MNLRGHNHSVYNRLFQEKELGILGIPKDGDSMVILESFKWFDVSRIFIAVS